MLFDVAVNPATGELWVPNTEARNLVRFEPNLRGHLVQTRVTRVNAGTGAVAGVADLNPHINYGTTPGPAGEVAASLAQPGDGAFAANGATYYVAAFGSGKVGVLNAAGAVTARIAVGGGPSGVALAESAGRLFVLNRFDNTISTVDTASNTQIATIGVAGAAKFDPSPDVIKAGRKFLYDAALTSGHGDVACATCHVFGNLDGLAWDLGDPQGEFVDFDQTPWVTFAPLGPSTNGFDPMKGPMTTQTLRGLAGLEPFHWRGDRQNFQHFNAAFADLLGRSGPLLDRRHGRLHRVHHDGELPAEPVPEPRRHDAGVAHRAEPVGRRRDRDRQPEHGPDSVPQYEPRRQRLHLQHVPRAADGHYGRTSSTDSSRTRRRTSRSRTCGTCTRRSAST